MNRGLTLRNLAGELVVHHDSWGTQCIGRATMASLVQPSSESDGSRIAGYSTHTFASTRPILWAIDLPVGRRVGVVSTRHVNGAYTLGVYCGSSPDSGGFDQQFAVDVWAFATLVAPSGGGGLRLRNSEGVVTHDFSVPNITFPIASGDLDISANLPAVGRPVAIGNSPYYDVQYETNEVNFYKIDRREFLMRTEDNVVAYSTGVMYRSGNMSGTIPDGSTFSEPSPFFVVDGSLLP